MAVGKIQQRWMLVPEYRIYLQPVRRMPNVFGRSYFERGLYELTKVLPELFLFLRSGTNATRTE